MQTMDRSPAIRVVMLPKDTNAQGTIFGGVILSYVDEAGGIEARKHADKKFVTVAMKEVEFLEPVQVGDLVSFYTSTVRIGRSSVTVHVDVEAQRHEDYSQRVKVTEAEVIYVAIDDQGRPVPVKD
ncbi:MAG: acyl-CoA thioesterase [Planctomycetota bacterium]|nr:acyl-CoA thioesterase [Planctomycetota bacterium]